MYIGGFFMSRKTTSFKIRENIKKEFQIECIKNNTNMSDVLEDLMVFYYLKSRGKIETDNVFDLIGDSVECD